MKQPPHRHSDATIRAAHELGELLRRYRKAAKLKQPDMAVKGAVSLSLYGELERGTGYCPHPRVFKAFLAGLLQALQDAGRPLTIEQLKGLTDVYARLHRARKAETHAAAQVGERSEPSLSSPPDGITVLIGPSWWAIIAEIMTHLRRISDQLMPNDGAESFALGSGDASGVHVPTIETSDAKGSDALDAPQAALPMDDPLGQAVRSSWPPSDTAMVHWRTHHSVVEDDVVDAGDEDENGDEEVMIDMRPFYRMTRSSRTHRWRRGRWIAGGAVAVALLAVLIWLTSAGLGPFQGSTIQTVRLQSGQCDDAPAGAIAVGRVTVNGAAQYTTEGTTGWIVQINRAATVCALMSEGAILQSVGQNQDLLWPTILQDAQQLKAHGCVANQGCQRVAINWYPYP